MPLEVLPEVAGGAVVTGGVELVGGMLDVGGTEDSLVSEETGITLQNWDYRGIVTFVSDKWGGEYMHLFTASVEDEYVSACTEGDLCWIDEDKILSLNLWEGDRVFLTLLENNEPFFSLKLSYVGDALAESCLNGQKI